MKNPAQPLVGLIMGSDSDWPTMEAAFAVCGDFAVPCEVQVVSAHRTPDDMARTFLGEKRVTRTMIDTWKREHGYDLPRLINTRAAFPGTFTETIFWQKNARLFILDFGKSDMDGAQIGAET